MNYTEKNKLMDRLCGIGLMLIFVEVFLALVNEGFNSFKFISSMETTMNITGAVFLIIGITVLTIAYKKNNSWRAIYGIEFIVLAFLTILLSGSYLTFHYPFNLINKILPYFILIYYIIKAAIVCVMVKKKRKK